MIGPRSAVLGPITRPMWKKSRNDTILYIEREHINNMHTVESIMAFIKTNNGNLLLLEIRIV